jgi:hypothetical protein
MKKSVSFFGTAVIAMVVLAALVILPVSGMVYPLPTTSSSAETSLEPVTVDVTATLAAKHFVSATVSPGSLAVGEPVIISGTVTGSMLPANVRIWVFAGNYVNVSTVPVNADGTFSWIHSSTGLPLATYYVYVQSPGANGKYNLDLKEAGIYSGQVVNTSTNALIFNFTGAGSVQDAAASQALSDAINNQGVDDAYTKLTFQLIAPGHNAITLQKTTSAPVTSAVPGEATTAKSPLPLEITGLALMMGGLGAAMYMRKLC